MFLMYYTDDNGNRIYTMKKIDPNNKPTVSAHPARFSPEDRYSRQRITIKRRFGLLLTQQPKTVYWRQRGIIIIIIRSDLFCLDGKLFYSYVLYRGVNFMMHCNAINVYWPAEFTFLMVDYECTVYFEQKFSRRRYLAFMNWTQCSGLLFEFRKEVTFISFI